MIRKLKSEDRDILENMLAGISQFKKVECDVAMELIDIAIFRPLQEDYFIYVFEDNDKILGYYCTGQRPLTDGVFDLYWIAVDPLAQGKGIGKKLLMHSEELVRIKNARWLLAETSSREDYKLTRDFYLNNGYSIVAQIDNFYSVNDSLVIFGKYF
jgi:GNAT superfamily N-acetyltransferase